MQEIKDVWHVVYTGITWQGMVYTKLLATCNSRESAEDAKSNAVCFDGYLSENLTIEQF